MQNEVVENVMMLEDSRISPSNSTVKLTLKSHSPNAKDYYYKLIYDKLRNRSAFEKYTKAPTHKKVKRESIVKNARKGEWLAKYIIKQK